MNNDYLWDRTGEPDAEVQELEEVLGTLRYQPQPLILPEDARMGGSRKWYPILAIAATIALIALALGIWLRVQHRQSAQPDQVTNKNSNRTTEQRQAVVPKDSPSPQSESPEPKETIPNAPRTPSHNPSLARHLNRTRPSRPAEQMSAANRAEAEAAKQQLMLALRVVSAKLNFAQRKAVPGNNNIRYQHKVG